MGITLDERFGELLRRSRARVSQRGLAVRAGTSQSYVSRVEAGEISPTLEQAERLALALGFRLRIDLEPLPTRRDEAGKPDALTMTFDERLESAAALHNLAQELRASGPA